MRLTGLFFPSRDFANLYWHSNVIIERIEYNKLRTLSGNIYILKGIIDKNSMKEEGNFIVKIGGGGGHIC